MRQETVEFFTEKEEEFVNLLIDIGTKKNVAKILVHLASTPETTSRDIERGTDLRQPEVSVAMKYLIERGWIWVHDDPSSTMGRPKKVYKLATPISKIMDSFEEDKKEEAKKQQELVRKIKNFL